MASVTLREVAERAGVSLSTASRILNGNQSTTPETRAKVMAAADELSYVANSHARALSANTITGSVAVVVTSVTSEAMMHIVSGIQEQAYEEGKFCLVCTSNNDASRELALIQAMREQRCQAIMLIGSIDATPDYFDQLARHARGLASNGGRLVQVMRLPLPADVPSLTISIDNRHVAYIATNHLLSLGHRRILYLGKREGQTTFLEGLAGYRDALAQYDLDVDESLLVPGRHGRKPGYQMVRDRLAAGPIDFTAILAADDQTAAGTQLALHEYGLRTPDDVSLIGSGDLPAATDLRLTTVHTPHEELGRAAVRQSLHGDDTRELGSGSVVQQLGTYLVMRESTGPVGSARV